MSKPNGYSAPRADRIDEKRLASYVACFLHSSLLGELRGVHVGQLIFSLFQARRVRRAALQFL